MRIQSSLRDFRVFYDEIPSDKSLGYFRLSLTGHAEAIG